MNEAPIRRVTILGVGALGCLFGSRLQGLAEVTLVGSWPEQLRRLQLGPLEVREKDGSRRQVALPATDDLASVPPAELVLVLVKSSGTRRAAEQARQALAPGGLALTLQNGLGNLEILQQALGPANAALGSTTEGAHMVAPGIVGHAGSGLTHLASAPETAERLAAVAGLFREAGFEVRQVEDASGLVWGKVAVNAAINPLTALLGVPNGRILEEPEALALADAAAREVAAVAEARGVALPFPDAAERAREVCRETAANRSSMLQDLGRGAVTEIDAISGAVAGHGRECGVAVPVNEALWRRVRAREGRRAPAGRQSTGAGRILRKLEELEGKLRTRGGRKMDVVTTIEELRRHRRRSESKSWGLVPTMGYLHDGHLSLVERARHENERVAVSLFVNPTQFGEAEDLAKYPRDEERDFELLRQAKVDVVFAPPPEEVYPPGFQTYVTVEEVSRPLEGDSRPTHFRGVATVVAKLFNLVRPARAYFGQKDAQQTVVIRRMAEDLGFDLEVIVCPTVREKDGLAMSSRNARLSPRQRAAAPVLHRALQRAAEALERGEVRAAVLRHLMTEEIAAEPLAEIDYVSVADPMSLDELETVEDEALLSLAAFFGKIRLIDNLLAGTP